jgi:PAS domain S-box-containing protein
MGTSTPGLREAEPVDALTARRPDGERPQSAFERAGVGLAELSLEGRWLRVNPCYCEVLGYPAEELRAMRWREVTHPEDVEELVSGLGRLVRGETAGFECQSRQLRKDGRVLWVELVVTLAHSGQGRAPRFVVVSRDITAARAAREALELVANASARLGATLDPAECVHRLAHLAVPALADGCAVLIEHEGSGELELSAVAHRDAERAARVLDSQRARPFRAPADGWIERARRAGSPLAIAVEDTNTLDGPFEPLWLMRELGARALACAPLRARGRAFGALVLARADVERAFRADALATLQRLAERASVALDNARVHHDAQRAVRLREQTLAVVSHDLRNPLSAIDLGSQLLTESPSVRADAAATRQAAVIRRNAARMARLIGDLLDVSSMQAGALAMERRPLPLAGLLVEAFDAHEPIAREKGVSLVLDAGPGHVRVRADRDRLMQVLANLLGNAIKFCAPADEVRLSAEPADGYVRVCVADTGPGIPEEDRPHVFDVYWKGRRGGGTGLGLAIARGIVEAHGGRIEASPNGVRGARLCFTLPVER